MFCVKKIRHSTDRGLFRTTGSAEQYEELDTTNEVWVTDEDKCGMVAFMVY